MHLSLIYIIILDYFQAFNIEKSCYISVDNCTKRSNNGYFFNFSSNLQSSIDQITFISDKSYLILPLCSKKLKAFHSLLTQAQCQIKDSQFFSSYPDQEICENIHNECLFRDGVFINIPEILRNCSHFPQKCPLIEEKWKFLHQTSADPCPRDLVQNNFSKAHIPFQNLSHCSLPCHEAFPSSNTETFMFWINFSAFILVTMMNSLVFVLYFYIKKIFLTNSMKLSPIIKAIYQAHMYISISCLSMLIGYSSQLIFQNNNIACSKGILRRSEPNLKSDNSLVCLLTFLLFYFPFISFLKWLLAFFLFSFLRLHRRSLRKFRKSTHQEYLLKKYEILRVIIPTLSIFLTFTIITLGSIDGDYINGICFPSQMYHFKIFLVFFLAPLLLFGLLILSTIIANIIYLQRHAGKRYSSTEKYFSILLTWLILILVLGLFPLFYAQHQNPIWLEYLVKEHVCRYYHQMNANFSHEKSIEYCRGLNGNRSNVNILMIPGLSLCMTNMIICIALLPKKKLFQLVGSLLRGDTTSSCPQKETFSFWDDGIFGDEEKSWRISSRNAGNSSLENITTNSSSCESKSHQPDNDTNEGGENLSLTTRITTRNKRKAKHLSKLAVSSKRFSSAKSLSSVSGTSKKLSQKSSVENLMGSLDSQKSYNSYQLMLKQYDGAEWREKWKTRMLLMDAIKWAENFKHKTDQPDLTMTSNDIENLKIFFEQIFTNKIVNELNKSEVLSLDESKDASCLNDVLQSKESNYFDSESETMSIQDENIFQATSKGEKENFRDFIGHQERRTIGHILEDNVKNDFDNFIMSSIDN